MTETERSESDRIEEARERLLDAMLPHVPFDGWSRATIDAAAREAGVDPGLARLAFPRGGVDAALALHRRGDRRMVEAIKAMPLAAMGVTEKVTAAVRKRLEIAAEHREAARRAAALLSLPIHAADAARAMWETADAIWTAIGDPSDDINWYTKRAILAGVYSSVALYWLGDESEGFSATWIFLDRRMDDVMRFEKAKAAVRRNPLGRLFFGTADRMLSMIHAPGAARGAAGPGGPGGAAGAQDAAAGPGAPGDAPD